MREQTLRVHQMPYNMTDAIPRLGISRIISSTIILVAHLHAVQPSDKLLSCYCNIQAVTRKYYLSIDLVNILCRRKTEDTSYHYEYHKNKLKISRFRQFSNITAKSIDF